jgi:precorrin-8X/cobalt-precorrin-8 methylmutase
MISTHLTIKELTDKVGDVTPRMVRHYHQLGILPAPERSQSNYRLYTDQDVQRLRRIVALKQQGFQLAHIKQVLDTDFSESAVAQADPADLLIRQLQQQYQTVMQQLVRLRHTASALEGLIGRDRHCQIVQAEVLAQLRLLEAEAQAEQGGMVELWNQLDAGVSHHPEDFQDALQRLLPDLSERSEIEVDLLSELVIACGDVSLVPFVQLSQDAIKAARDALQTGCPIVGDVQPVVAALDHTRLAHLGCPVLALMDNLHIHNATDAEQAFWQAHHWQQRLLEFPENCIVVVGYAPSVLMAVCEAIEQQQLKPALVIGMPIGFSHAPAAKRRLMRSGTAFVTTEGTLGGGLLAAVALNALVKSLLEKPDCHCYLAARNNS